MIARMPYVWLFLSLAVFLPMKAVSGEPSTSASAWVTTRMADIRLVSAAAGAGSAASVPLGLQFKLAEGWKIYWRSPGDAGFPPDLEVKTAENLRDLDWQWPVPQRFSLFGLESYGYHDEVVFPITAHFSEPGKPLTINAVVHALACSEICVPLDAALSFTLPAGPAGPTAFTQLVSRYKSRVPRGPNGTGLSIAKIDTVGSPEPHSIAITIASDQPLGAPDVFIEAETGYAFEKPVLEFSSDRRSAILTIPASRPKTGSLQALPVTLTVVDGDQFFETKAVVVTSISTVAGANSSAGDPASSTTSFGVWVSMLGIGLLGGLILNLMPCVLPVLSLKLLGVLRYGGVERRLIRGGFLTSAAGIISCFLLLAAGIILLKQAGHAVGWGIQFQQPLFLAAMITLLAGFAANLFGWLEIPLPAFLGRLGALGPGAGTPTNIHANSQAKSQGNSGRHAHSLLGHFLTGAFAAFLATPCSAPFVGTALGFALARGPVEILTIFMALGVGMALPYLLVAAQPRLVQMLPRPGRWMDHMRKVLGIGLLVTAIWLLSIMAVHLDTVWLAAMTVLLVAAGLLLALSKGRSTWIAPTLSGGLALAVLMIGGLAGHRPQPENGTSIETAKLDDAPVAWIDFEPAKLASLVGEGRIMFVDVTADWCLTCKVNKSLVLDQGAVADRLNGADVVAMRADWTKPDASVAAYLASFGRYGIPFNAVYGPAAPQGIALPELLTVSVVLDALKKAAGAAETVKRTASVMPNTAASQ
jgi:suppressor for copper-sensitivity B